MAKKKQCCRKAEGFPHSTAAKPHYTITMRLFCLFLLLFANAASAFDMPSTHSEIDFAHWIHSQHRTSAMAPSIAHQTVMLAMPDGIKLYTSIYPGPGSSKYPVI